MMPTSVRLVFYSLRVSWPLSASNGSAFEDGFSRYLSLTSNRYTDVKRLADCRVTRLTNGDDTDRAYLSDGEADVRVRNQAWDFEEVGRSLQLTAAPIYEAFKLKQASVMFLGSLKCEPEVPTAWNQLLAEETRNLIREAVSSDVRTNLTLYWRKNDSVIELVDRMEKDRRIAAGFRNKKLGVSQIVEPWREVSEALERLMALAFPEEARK